MRSTNTKAVWALVASLLALAALGVLVYMARRYDGVRVIDAVVAVPIAVVFASAGVVLNRRARAEHQRTIGRSGSPLFLGFTRLLGTITFLLAITAALALAVFAVLVLVFE
jgi:ABC-type sulfate transport system permease component